MTCPGPCPPALLPRLLAALLVAAAAGCPPGPPAPTGSAGTPGAPQPTAGGTAGSLGPNADDLCNRAEGKLAAGQVAEALADLEGAASLEKTNPRVFHLKGVAHTRLGELEDAKADFARVLSLQPPYTDPTFVAEAVGTYVAAGDPRGAEPFLARAPQGTGPTRLLQARVKAALGDLTGAAQDLKAALAAVPPAPGAEEFQAELAKQEGARRSRYVPTPAERRLGAVTLSLAGRLQLRLPSGFEPAGSGDSPRAVRRGDPEVSLRLKPIADLGDDLAAALSAAASGERNAGATVTAAQQLEIAGAPGYFLGVVEPGPESGMFDAFAVVRYRWVVLTEAGGVEIRVEAEVAPDATDLPDEVRLDLLAALATAEAKG